MAGIDHTARIAGTVAPLLEPLGLVLEEVALTPAGKRRLLRISIDVDPGHVSAQDQDSIIPPLSLDQVAEATRVISAALDETEPLGNTPYVLEVTSPGVGRPLTLPRHYRRNVGRLLAITPTSGDPLTGRLLAASPTDLTVHDADDVRHVVPLAQIARARVELEFTRVQDQPDDDRDGLDDDRDELDDDRDELDDDDNEEF